jgi:hypothetical protein
MNEVKFGVPAQLNPGPDGTSKHQLAKPNAADVIKEVKRRIARLYHEVTEAQEFYTKQLSDFDSVTESVRSLSDNVVRDRMWRKKIEGECNSDTCVEEEFVCTPKNLEDQCDELKRTSAGLLTQKDEYESKYIHVLVKSVDSAVAEAVNVAENARHSYKACQAAVKMLEIVKCILEKEIDKEKAEEKVEGQEDIWGANSLEGRP